MIGSHEVGATKMLVVTTKTPSSNNPYTLLSNLLTHLALWKIRLIPYHRGTVGHPQERDASRVSLGVEVVHFPEVGDRDITPDPAGGTASVSHKGDTTKLGCITFYPGGMYTNI